MNSILFKALAFACANTLIFVASLDGHEKLNVLFIAVDDLRPELGAYSAPVITPNMDQFARSAMRFDRAYCQQAVCGASRLSIMSGLYPTKTKEQTFHVTGWRNRYPDLLTMNQHFGAQGYQTIGLGKIYHGTGGPGVDKANWEQWIDLYTPDYALEKNREAMKKFRERSKVGGKHDPAKGPTTELADVADDTYPDGQRASKAVEVLKQLSRSNKPFFFAVGLTKPHLPFAAPKKYWDLYQRENFKMPNNKGLPPKYPKYAANLPAWEMKKYSDYVGESPQDFPEDMNKRLLHGYCACVSYTDANIGRILDALKETGLDKNTMVVFWGDHGWKLGDHSTWCKHTNLECDTRVPLIIRVPGKPAGQACNKVVELIDLYPTLCELNSIPTPSHCQGKSLVRLLNDPQTDHRRSAYSSYPAGDREIGHSIRFDKYRYTEWRLRENNERTGKFVLTDLVADPGEVTNVANQPEHQQNLRHAKEILQDRIESALN